MKGKNPGGGRGLLKFHMVERFFFGLFRIMEQNESVAV